MHLPQQSLIPSNEEDRLLALSRYQILGTTPERLFDDLAALTAKLFNTPIALVSLVTDDSVWFKANFGLPDAERIARAESLCSVAILRNEATIFEDLTQQPCALVEPQVLQALELQFYAGYPLHTPDGFNIGALCVIDREPRTFLPDEEALLQHLATTVLLLLELRRTSSGPAEVVGPAWEKIYTAIPPLIHSLTLLAEIGSTGTAVDVHGTLVGTTAIHHEAGQLTVLINRTISALLAEYPARPSAS
ncbi:GAF domain-containing protein [Hymenobacter elongatus]|nr:GAF domain-containing protein [Hymenobacter elongatus]